MATTLLQPGDRVLLTGDSITDADRDRSDPAGLGTGYAALVARWAQHRRPDLDLTFRNTGIGGDTTAQLAARVQRDVLDVEPDVVSVLIGINDTWQTHEHGRVWPIDAFALDLRVVLDAARDRLGARLVLIEPFVLPVLDGQHRWREDLGARVDVVRELAEEYDAALVPADDLFVAAAARTAPQDWAYDGVHPTEAGHALLAEAWLETVGLPAPDDDR